MNEKELKERTKRFALRILRLTAALPRTPQGRTVSNQLVRAGTSVGANYPAVCRARSKAEFTARLGVVEEEADESAFWMELIIERKLMRRQRVADLLGEANELSAIMTSSRITAGRSQISSEPRQSKIKSQKSKIP